MPPRYRNNPTAWPNAGYFFLRFIQLICTIGVMGTLSYFIYVLAKAHMGVPYEFIVEYAVAVLSLLTIVSTNVAKCCGALNPLFALALDFITLAGWSIAFGLLAHAMGKLPFEDCTAGAWGVEGGTGVYVCRLYKATWAFSVTVIAMYAFSCILDGIVIKRVNSHKYAPANPKSMQQTKEYKPNYTQDTSYGSGGLQ